MLDVYIDSITLYLIYKGLMYFIYVANAFYVHWNISIWRIYAYNVQCWYKIIK